jgi:hypothetical protein
MNLVNIPVQTWFTCFLILSGRKHTIFPDTLLEKLSGKNSQMNSLNTSRKHL